MGSTTGIEWTDSTWNPIRGCSRVSEGCRNCYAELMAARFSQPGQWGEGLAVMQHGKPRWTGKVDLVEKHLLDPLKWRPVIDGCRGLENSGVLHDPKIVCRECVKRPRRIFVNSLSDLFHENVTDEMRDRIFAVMALCPQHIFQVLTKRPERMLEYFAGPRVLPSLESMPSSSRQAIGLTMVGMVAEEPHVAKLVAGMPGDVTVSAEPGCEGALTAWPLPNVWLGVSVENQAAADDRIPLLLVTPAAVRFLSAEPLLGRIDLKRYVWLPRGVQSDLPWLMGRLYAPPGLHECRRNQHGAVSVQVEGKMLGVKPDEMEPRDVDWVICGGESGPGARPMHPDWVRGLRDQCQAAGVPFFFKQWGEWTPGENVDAQAGVIRTAHWFDGDWSFGWEDLAEDDGHRDDEPDLYRIGKKAAGARIDGVEHKAFPELR